MNRPADDKGGTTITTHYDYHSINDRLVKLDILGHDDPMVLKMLEKYLQEDVDPNFDPKKIPVGDEATMRIFQDTSSLGVTPEQIDSAVGKNEASPAAHSSRLLRAHFPLSRGSRTSAFP